MEEFDRLVEIFERLRGPGGCPWDAEQTHRSISRCALEEAYELFDAIESNDTEHMKEELGDLLLQVLFHSTIAKDLGEFTIRDVINDLAKKLIHRHPHVFGNTLADTSKDVIRNWEQIKQKEQGKRERTSILDGIPESLPGLLHARKVQSVVSRVGFDWQDPSGAIEKIQEELGEVMEALQKGDHDEIVSEIGDLLFSMVNYARLLKVDPEAALRKTIRSFKERFRAIEDEARTNGISLDEMTLEEMDRIWEQAKRSS
ncbi:MAG TPA: nucleoside triphosphate pyrophosphohydrolase [Deltaproteobacteria bacterium]|nr:nucleoside triphosphate pyrophosphohydrolase [Deltaproteobacteria bacterium]